MDRTPTPLPTPCREAGSRRAVDSPPRSSGRVPTVGSFLPPARFAARAAFLPPRSFARRSASGRCSVRRSGRRAIPVRWSSNRWRRARSRAGRRATHPVGPPRSAAIAGCPLLPGRDPPSARPRRGGPANRVTAAPALELVHPPCVRPWRRKTGRADPLPWPAPAGSGHRATSAFPPEPAWTRSSRLAVRLLFSASCLASASGTAGHRIRSLPGLSSRLRRRAA